MMKIGAQLYTLHDYCKTLEDFAETLKRVADMGYTAVQVSGTCDFEAEWLAEQLKKNGLVCPLTHTKYDKILNETEKTIAEHTVFGCDHIGLGALPGIWDKDEAAREAAARKFAVESKAAAQTIAKAGKLFMYHNHHYEYMTSVDGKNVMKYLADEFAPNELGFTLDTYWVKAGGCDPVEEINRLSGRLPCVHFKDYKLEADGTNHYTWCGDGILDFEKIGDALVAAGTEYVFIEQDSTFPDEPNPFVCLANSRGYLKSLGFKF
jgi:sugar phosphate isomerase/epimerase